MASRTKTITQYVPATADEAKEAVLEFLSSDGSDETLHERSLAGLRFLEQDRLNISLETHKMRMAVVAWRTDKIRAQVRRTS